MDISRKTSRNTSAATLAILAAALLSLHAGSVRATYSIVAVDRATAQVGGSGTSCVGDLRVYVI